jgi:hypothetical protein
MTVTQTSHSRRRALLTLVSVGLAAIGFAVSSHADSPAKRTLVTINRAMALPGVTLQPGAYSFEVINPDTTADVVVVRGGLDRQVRFQGLTRPADRPRNLPPNQPLSFGEAATGDPLPIRAWYPTGYASGHQFIW